MTPKQKFEMLTTSKEKKYQQAQFEFALLCAERTIEEKTPIVIVEFFTLVAIMRTSEDFGDIGHLKDGDYGAAYWAAYSAAYLAAERKVQYRIAEYVWKKWV